MKNIAVLILFGIGILSCSSSKTISNDENGIGIRKKTSNPNTPYIYKNGYRDFEITPTLTVNENDSTYINELRFNAVFSSMYTKKLMFDEFGKWDKEIRPNNERHPILVWENKRLFNKENKTYSIAASGIESKKEMYASVIVFDSENRDCLSETHPKKDSIINYFSNGIINLKSDRMFYDTYWKMISDYQ